MKRRHTRKRPKKVYRGGNNIKMGVMAMFKNEAMVLKEWIEHYIWQGADTILLMNNNSTDDYKNIIDQFKDKVHLIDTPDEYSQIREYNDKGIPFFKKHKIDTLVIVDVDEYMFGKDGSSLKKHVIDIFGKPERPSQFSCKWTMFGSSGHEKHPESIRKSFTWKQKGTAEETKSVVWVNDVISVDLHKCQVKGKTIPCPRGIQLNHYAIMSKEYFEKVKMTRGDAVQPSAKHTRDWNYFKGYDHREEEDTTLKDLILKI